MYRYLYTYRRNYKATRLYGKQCFLLSLINQITPLFHWPFTTVQLGRKINFSRNHELEEKR